MKKALALITGSLLLVMLCVSCDGSTKTADSKYSIGKTGPGGGIIFYVSDKVMTSSITDMNGDERKISWKYLEIAPEDAPGKGDVEQYVWGASGDLKTGTAIGDGWLNTQKLDCDDIRKYPAAEACRSYEANGFSDWFLPSKDEMKAVYENLKGNEEMKWKTGYGGYWTSSENTEDTLGEGAWAWNPQDGTYKKKYRTNTAVFVRPVRAFR